MKNFAKGVAKEGGKFVRDASAAALGGVVAIECTKGTKGSKSTDDGRKDHEAEKPGHSGQSSSKKSSSSK